MAISRVSQALSRAMFSSMRHASTGRRPFRALPTQTQLLPSASSLPATPAWVRDLSTSQTPKISIVDYPEQPPVQRNKTPITQEPKITTYQYSKNIHYKVEERLLNYHTRQFVLELRDEHRDRSVFIKIKESKNSIINFQVLQQNDSEGILEPDEMLSHPNMLPFSLNPFHGAIAHFIERQQLLPYSIYAKIADDMHQTPMEIRGFVPNGALPGQFVHLSKSIDHYEVSGRDKSNPAAKTDRPYKVMHLKKLGLVIKADRDPGVAASRLDQLEDIPPAKLPPGMTLIEFIKENIYDYEVRAMLDHVLDYITYETTIQELTRHPRKGMKTTQKDVTPDGFPKRSNMTHTIEFDSGPKIDLVVKDGNLLTLNFEGGKDLPKQTQLLKLFFALNEKERDMLTLYCEDQKMNLTKYQSNIGVYDRQTYYPDEKQVLPRVFRHDTHAEDGTPLDLKVLWPKEREFDYDGPITRVIVSLPENKGMAELTYRPARDLILEDEYKEHENSGDQMFLYRIEILDGNLTPFDILGDDGQVNAFLNKVGIQYAAYQNEVIRCLPKSSPDPEMKGFQAFFAIPRDL